MHTNLYIHPIAATPGKIGSKAHLMVHKKQTTWHANVMLQWKKEYIPYNMLSLYVNPTISGEQLKFSKKKKFENVIMS